MLLLPLLLFFLRLAASEILQQLVASPVVFGHIHVFLDTDQLLLEMENIREEMSRLKKILRENGQTKLLKNIERAELARTEYLDEKLKNILMAVHPHSLDDSRAKTRKATKSRSKRELILIAIGALAVISLIAFGLSVANRVELDNLKSVVEQQDEDMANIVTTLETSSAEVSKNFRLINETLRNIEHRFEQERLWDGLKMRYRDLDARLDSVTEGIFSAYKGQLHPSLVSWRDLEASMRRIESYANTQGLKTVKFDNYMEAIFSQPVSVMTNGSGLHLVVSVPLIPLSSDVMDLVVFTDSYVEHHGGMAIRVAMQDEVVLADKRRRFFRSVSSGTLNSCKSFKSLWLCKFQEFSTNPNSCGTAYLMQDRSKLREFCTTSMVKQKVYFEQVPNGTFVRAQGEEIVHRECHDPALSRTYRVDREGLIEDKQGCYLETSSRVFYPSRPPLFSRDVYIASSERLALSWHLEDLEEDVDLAELVQVGHELAELRNLTDVELSFDEVKRHLRERRRDLHQWMSWGLSGLGLVLIGLIILCVVARVIQVYLRIRVTETGLQ